MEEKIEEKINQLQQKIIVLEELIQSSKEDISTQENNLNKSMKNYISFLKKKHKIKNPEHAKKMFPLKYEKAIEKIQFNIVTEKLFLQSYEKRLFKTRTQLFDLLKEQKEIERNAKKNKKKYSYPKPEAQNPYTIKQKSKLTFIKAEIIRLTTSLEAALPHKKNAILEQIETLKNKEILFLQGRR